jgi:hypothetical protein
MLSAPKIAEVDAIWCPPTSASAACPEKKIKTLQTQLNRIPYLPGKKYMITMIMKIMFRINKNPPTFNKVSACNTRLGARFVHNTEHVSFFVEMK